MYCDALIDIVFIIVFLDIFLGTTLIVLRKNCLLGPFDLLMSSYRIIIICFDNLAPQCGGVWYIGSAIIS